MKPSERLLELLVPVMEREGYVYRKTGHRFLKPFPCGNYEFSLMFDARGGLVGVDAGFFVHFEALEKHFEQALGCKCPWSAGATLLNAGANPWKLWLNEERFAALTPKALSAIPPVEIYPPARIEASVQFLAAAHAEFAAPLFQRLQTYRDLSDFYWEYVQNGCSGRCRPMAENVVYLWFLTAAILGDDLEVILASAQNVGSPSIGHHVPSKLQAVRRHIESNDLRSLPR